MNKYFTNKPRLFFSYNTFVVEKSHKETSTQFACFVTPSALEWTLFPTTGMSLSESGAPVLNASAA